MYRDKTVGAVILAAGKSNRMDGDLNKVYRELGNKTVLQHSIETFTDSGITDDLVLVYNGADKAQLERKVIPEIGSEASVSTVVGGEKRQDSSLAGLRELKSDYVFVHDGARPNFTSQLTEKLLQASIEYRAAFPGIRPVDTIRKRKNGFAGSTVDRDGLVRVQTPQCFERELVLEALQESVEVGKYYSDDSGAVMEYWDIDPKIVTGDRENVKLTTEKDMKFAELLFTR